MKVGNFCDCSTIGKIKSKIFCDFSNLQKISSRMMIHQKLLFISLSIPFCLAIHSLKYSDLEAMDADCRPRDTCNTTQRVFDKTNCECDTKCQLYDDCCIDAKLSAAIKPLHDLTCIVDGRSIHRGIYSVNACKPLWSGASQIRQKCETMNDLSDPFLASPATDINTNTTYKNRFCAECNDVNPLNLRSWTLGYTCESLKHVNKSGNITNLYVKDRLMFKTSFPNRNKWGIMYWNKEAGRDTFYPCELAFWLPNDLESRVRFCRPNMISHCATNWRVNSVRRNCAAYTAVIYIKSSTYKNPHCARCNNVELNNTTVSCTSGLLSRAKPPMSFTLLLDINFKDGAKVGEVNPCKTTGQIYDSIFKRCRTITCVLPGYKLKNNKCVKT